MSKLYCKFVASFNTISNVDDKVLLNPLKNLFILSMVNGYASKPKMQHIGVLDACKADANYNVGQTFFHKVFAYRGIILHPWTAHIYEQNRSTSAKSVKNQNGNANFKKCLPKLETYYQVLVDARDSSQLDCHYSEAVTMLCSSSSRSDAKPLLHAIAGIDYVSHEDIIPYTSCEDIPVHHNFFDKFFVCHSKKRVFQPTEPFNVWQKENQICLELMNVHRETTDHIRVTAMPFFLGADKPHPRVRPPEYWWRFCIRIENFSGINAQLRETNWRTISNGTVNTRREVGIIGKEPNLSNEQPAFQIAIKPFSLATTSGNIWGTFRLEKEDGEIIDVKIPAFSLESRVQSDMDLSSVDD